MSWIDSLMFTTPDDDTLNARIAQSDLEAQGKGGPTAADALLERQTGRNVAAQYALGQTLRQRTAAGASRQASEGAAAANATGTALGVDLRRQEQLDARARSDALHAYQQQLEQAKTNARNKLLGGLVNVIAPSILGLGPTGGGAIGGEQAAPATPSEGTGAASSALSDGGGAAAGQAAGQAGEAASSNAGLGLGDLAGAGVDEEAVSLVSDRRAKKRIRGGGSALNRLAEALHPVEFQYKDPANGRGERIGVIAQDAEKGGPLGRDMVEHESGGLRLDTGNAIGAALAGFAELHRRVEALERGRHA